MGAVANQLQDQNPGQKSPEYGQYGQHGQAKGPAMSPYSMNSNANENKRQNDYNQAIGNQVPRLPSNLSEGQEQHWYPGMYPSTQPQFGTNPYSPQTANLSGHPGHNPSAIQNLEPNKDNGALSRQGQFVKTMATGGNSGSFSSNQPAMWQGTQGTTSGTLSNVFPGYTYNPTGGYYTDSKGVAYLPTQGNQSTGNSMMSAFGYSPQQTGQKIGNGWYMTPVGGKGGKPSLSKGPNGKGPDTGTTTPTPPTPPTPPTANTNVYKPAAYETYGASINQNLDSFGNPLYAHGGLLNIPYRR